MEALLHNFRGGKHTKYNNQMIALVDSIKSRNDATKLEGKKVSWKTSSGKIINGYISRPHGNKGALRIVFEKGMPGQSINTKINIEA